MKNIKRFVSVLLICLFFTSCVDYVQSISYIKGNYKMYYKVTLSKVLFAMFDEEALTELPEKVCVRHNKSIVPIIKAIFIPPTLQTLQFCRCEFLFFRHN